MESPNLANYGIILLDLHYRMNVFESEIANEYLVISLPTMKLSRSHIESCLKDSKLNRDQFQLDDENLSGLDLSGLDLSGVSFRRTNLIGTNLCGATLTEAVLTNSDLSDAKLITANLFKANLAAANLDRANLMAANLEKANLTDSKCNEANFIIASLRNATLDGGNFEQAHLNGTDFRGCILSNINLDGIFYNHLTKWPDGFDPKLAKGRYNKDIDRKLSELYRIYNSALVSRNTVSSISFKVPETFRSKRARIRTLEYVGEQIKARESEWDIVRKMELRSDTGKELQCAFIEWLKVLEKLAFSKIKEERLALKQQKNHLEAVLWESYIKHKDSFPLPVLYSCKWFTSGKQDDVIIKYQTLRSFISKKQFIRFHEKCCREFYNDNVCTYRMLVMLLIILMLAVAFVSIFFWPGNLK